MSGVRQSIEAEIATMTSHAMAPYAHMIEQGCFPLLDGGSDPLDEESFQETLVLGGPNGYRLARTQLRRTKKGGLVEF